MTRQQLILSYLVITFSIILEILLFTGVFLKEISLSIALPFILALVITKWLFFCMIMDDRETKKNNKIDYSQFGSDFDIDTERLNSIKQDKNGL